MAQANEPAATVATAQEEKKEPPQDYRRAVGLLLRTLRAEEKYMLYDSIASARSFRIANGNLVVGVDTGAEELNKFSRQLAAILREEGLGFEAVNDPSPATRRQQILQELAILSGGKLKVL